MPEMTLAEMIRERDRLNALIASEERRQREQRYRDLIRLHKIQLADVQTVNDAQERAGGYIGSFPQFKAWCDRNSNKRFREWNTLVYFASDPVIGMENELCDIDMLKGGEPCQK